MTCLYCVVGIEYSIMNVPIKMSIIGTFTDVDKALEFRKKQKKYTVVDIVETVVDNIIENEDVENEMDL